MSRPEVYLEGGLFCNQPETGIHHVWNLSQDLGLTPKSKPASRPTAPPNHIVSILTKHFGQAVLDKDIEDLGQVYLSPQAQKQFNNFIKKEGAGYAVLEDPENISLYQKVPYKELQYRDGTPVFDPIPAEDGYAWIKTGADYTSANLPDALTGMVETQGFTFNQPTDISADENRYSFYIKDIMNDFPALKSQKDALRPNQIIYPKADLMVPPNRQTCRAAIKKLDYCLKSSSGVDCQKDLLKNKITVLRCGDLKMFGGVLGVKDEYENVLRRGAPYGVADLARVLGKAQYGSVQKESLDNKINRILNEQFKKFRF